MKKLLTIACIFICALMLFACTTPETFSGNQEEPLKIDAYVTLSNAGELAIQQEKITATDLNNDKKVSIDEVLVAAHKAKDKEGDYASANSDWGLSITKLWGDESGLFSYYLNNQMVMTDLNEEVKSGDHLNAFVYKNADWSDTYTYFDVAEVTAVKGTQFELTLNYVTYNDGFSIAGSKIIVNGDETEYVTDADGRVKLTFAATGTYVLSATSQTETLVPAVCVVTVK